MRVPQLSRLSPRALAPCDLPGFALAPLGIDEFIAFLPAHLKAQSIAPQQPEPGTMTITAIKDVAHLPSPALGHLAQQAVLLLARLSRHTFVPLPPAHGHHLGDPVCSHQQQAFPLIATHTHRQATGLIVETFAAARQASHFAGAHRPQALQFLAFRFFHHATIPDAQRRFTALLHLLSALLGFLPQHLFDHFGLPALMMQGVLQSLSSGLGVGWTADGTAQFTGGQRTATLHDGADRGHQIAHHPSIHIDVQPLLVGPQIPGQLLGPQLAFVFFAQRWLLPRYVILKGHASDLLCSLKLVLCFSVYLRRSSLVSFSPSLFLSETLF